MNALTWLALGAALYGCGLLFAIAICRAGAEADRRTEEWMQSKGRN